jgi:hypothetical protein
MKKKYLLVNLLIINIFFVTTNIFAFSDKDTHPDITEAAVYQSILGCDGDGCTYLKDNLGFKNKINEVVGSDKIITLLRNGAHTEDTGIQDLGRLGSCSRGLNHFYDPLKSTDDTSAGLDEWTYEFAPGSLKPIYFPWYWSGKSNLLWATSAAYSTRFSVDYGKKGVKSAFDFYYKIR